MAILEEIAQQLENGRAKAVTELVGQALAEGISAADILNGALITGMNSVGAKFTANEIYVPEVLVAARAMNSGLKLLRPCLQEEGVKPIGKAVICTVKGDMHDIGKNLVKMMMEGQGIECIDLGVDVAPEKIVETVKETGAQLVCLSALLTTTMNGIGDVVEALKAEGIRDSVKVMIGGAPVNEEFRQKVGADCYTVDAASASVAAKNYLTA